MGKTFHDREMVFEGRTDYDDGDGIPVEIIDDDTTERMEVPPTQDSRSGEHPAWTHGMRAAVERIDRQTAGWRSSMEAQDRRDREMPVDESSDMRSTSLELKAVRS